MHANVLLGTKTNAIFLSPDISPCVYKAMTFANITQVCMDENLATVAITRDSQLS